jgi:hypothetical protein
VWRRNIWILSWELKYRNEVTSEYICSNDQMPVTCHFCDSSYHNNGELHRISQRSINLKVFTSYWTGRPQQLSVDCRQDGKNVKGANIFVSLTMKKWASRCLIHRNTDQQLVFTKKRWPWTKVMNRHNEGMALWKFDKVVKYSKHYRFIDTIILQNKTSTGWGGSFPPLSRTIE